MRGWTFGAELELSDWPRHEPLPVRGMGIDERDVTMVNSCGVAVDPRGRTFHLGGEIQTAPTDSPEGQAEQLAEIMRRWPQTTVNYRSNLHVHVRVPGLRGNLEQLKRVQYYVHTHMPDILRLIEPIPEPTRSLYGDPAAYRGARARWARRKVSHHNLISAERVMWQMSAPTPEEFRDREYKNARTGRLHPAIAPRACVNLRQLWETDTVEFRHFPGTTKPGRLWAAVTWCQTFMSAALSGASILGYAEYVAEAGTLPKFMDYDHWLETGYQRTTVKHLSRPLATTAAQTWLEEQAEEIQRRGAPT